MKKLFYKFYFIRRGERRALLIFSLVLLLLVIVRILIENHDNNYGVQADPAFVESMALLKENIEKDDNSNSKPDNRYRYTESIQKAREMAVQPFLFDPNRISLDSLMKMNLPDFIARNMINYRKAGGKFMKPEDLKKIYGMDNFLFERLMPFINIVNNEPDKVVSEKIIDAYIDLPKLEINSTDSIELQIITGIGPSYARRIIKYRDLIGGYYTENQYWEIYGMDSARYIALVDGCTIDTNKIRRIVLLSAGFRELIKHPYIDKETTYALLQYREFADTLMSISGLAKNQIIENELFIKIKPYLTIH